MYKLLVSDRGVNPHSYSPSSFRTRVLMTSPHRGTMWTHLLAMLWLNRVIYEGHWAMKDKQRHSPSRPYWRHLATTQTSWPRARKDQKVLGRPANLKLQGSLATLISVLTHSLHHLFPLVTDKTNSQDARGIVGLKSWDTIKNVL